MRTLIAILMRTVLLRCGQQELTYFGHVQGVTTQANASLKQILEQHGITGTPTLLQQLVSVPFTATRLRKARYTVNPEGLQKCCLSLRSMAKEC